MLSAVTPLKLSLLGGGSDYPLWFHKFGGRVLGASINLYTKWQLNSAETSLTQKENFLINQIQDFTNLEFPEQTYLSTNSSELLQKGAGASSASILSLLALIHVSNGMDKTNLELANMAIEFEQRHLGLNVGNQDQLLSSIGGINKIIFNTDGTSEITPFTLPAQALHSLNQHLILIDTNQGHLNRHIISNDYINDNIRHERQIKRLMELATQGCDIIHKTDAVEHLGSLLNEAWSLKKELSPNMSNSSIDEIYSAIKSKGAFGAKLLGAGGGGFILAIANPDSQREITKIPNIKTYDICIENSGLTINKASVNEN